MSRVAIVTGGTRGIGRAICEALRDQGATVVANYAGNEEKARAFTDETGIKAYKWNVGDHEACLEGCGQVADEVGPVDILVNNAGITRDGTLLPSAASATPRRSPAASPSCAPTTPALSPARR